MNTEHTYVREADTLSDMLNDCSIDRVLAIDLSWNIIAWNKTSEDITGIPRDRLLGVNLLDAFPQLLQDQHILDAITAAMEGNKSFLPSQLGAFHRNYYENHFIPLRTREGQVIGVMNIMHDVAHRIKVEKQLQRLNEALEKKYQQLEKAADEISTFTYITSRDIKEPLKHVYTSLELLAKKEGQNLSNVSRGNLRRMQGSLNKMNLLIDDLLAVSGVGYSGQEPATVDLNEVVRDVTSRMADKLLERNAVIQTRELPRIRGHKQMIDYLVTNLIDNAAKFHQTDKQPVISISSEGPTITTSRHTPGLSEDKQYVTFSVGDNGIGIPSEDTGRIFNMFEKLHGRQYAGSGIGLTICKKVMEAHEGYIEVQSTEGEGSTFTCYFPIEQA